MVDELNRSFGLFLLILIGSAFVRIVSSSFHIMINFMEKNFIGIPFRIYFGLLEITCLFLIAHVSHQIRQEVNNFTSINLKY